MAKTINGVVGLIGDPSQNYIKQINDGTTTHDLAVVNGITFFNGQGDQTEGVTWDGQQPLQVVIPSVTDIIQDPVRFMGTIGSEGTLPSGYTAAKGDLFYITANCTFAGQVCEGGDMAIYDGSAWHVIQGENQVSFPASVDASGNKVVALGKTGVDVLNVEGKTLTLSVDYSDVRSNMAASVNAATDLSLNNGKVTVSTKYLTLSQASGTSEDITTAVSFDLPTALADGAVTIADKVLASGDFTFASGSFPTISKNASAITVNASHSMTISASGTGDFVTGVTAIKAVTLEDGDETTNNIAYVAGLSSVSGKSFISGIHAHTATDGETAPDFTVPGVVTADASSNTFATGWGAEGASGDVVSSITVGTVTGNFLTGLSKGGSTVITSVTFGDVEQDSTKGWFVTGLNTTGTDVVTDVTVGATSLVADNSSSFASSAVVSASVSNHVLSFSTGSFMSPVKLSKAADTITKGGFNTGGVKLSGFTSASDTLLSGSVSQGTTTISYKSLTTGAVTLSQDTTGFHFDKAEGAAYTAVMGYKKITVTNADVTKSGAILENTAITANIPADTVAVGLNAGTLPSLTIGTASATISGTVGTALTTSSISFLAVDEAKKNIASAGAYTLVTANASGEGIVAVGKEGEYDVTGSVNIPASSYVTDVKVDGTTIVA